MAIQKLTDAGGRRFLQEFIHTTAGIALQPFIHIICLEGSGAWPPEKIKIQVGPNQITRSRTFFGPNMTVFLFLGSERGGGGGDCLVRSSSCETGFIAKGGSGSLFRQVVIPTGRYSDRSLFRQVDIPTNRSLFRQVVIPRGRYSDKQFVIPTGRYSDRSIVRQTGLYSDSSIVRQTGRYSERSIFRQVVIPT